MEVVNPLPADAEVVWWKEMSDSIEIIFKSLSFDVVPQGDPIPECDPIYFRNHECEAPKPAMPVKFREFF
jgi:hypothetical protein